MSQRIVSLNIPKYLPRLVLAPDGSLFAADKRRYPIARGRLEGTILRCIEPSCPYFGTLSAFSSAASAGFTITHVNTVSVLDGPHVRFLMTHLPRIHSLQARIALAPTLAQPVSHVASRVTARSKGISDLLVDYISGSVISADVAASCHVFDSESQRVLLNTNIDHRVHRALLSHLLNCCAPSFTMRLQTHDCAIGAAAVDTSVAVLCGLLLDEGSAVGLGPIRVGMYVPLLRDVRDGWVRCGDEEPIRRILAQATACLGRLIDVFTDLDLSEAQASQAVLGHLVHSFLLRTEESDLMGEVLPSSPANRVRMIPLPPPLPSMAMEGKAYIAVRGNLAAPWPSEGHSADSSASQESTKDNRYIRVVYAPAQ